MMCFSEIFSRLDIQQIREFLLNGVECVEIDTKTYEERLEVAGKAALDILHKRFPEMEAYEEITREVYNYVNTVENVYMEIGIQCGAVLATQLFANWKTKIGM
jgi:hypothetical protein